MVRRSRSCLASAALPQKSHISTEQWFDVCPRWRQQPQNGGDTLVFVSRHLLFLAVLFLPVSLLRVAGEGLGSDEGDQVERRRCCQVRQGW
ncbi:hypothetical protein E2C01_075664 [Portunus trituberculatus]|uniref:Uncharacterized protein n=1 Tax=Portunus trituberculatus TaxID=210409 RepID=A0A5B7IKV5_PORTR|nr:hypothetical protein [Portunus trituberculatus]